jgi:hypothetical protein
MGFMRRSGKLVLVAVALLVCFVLFRISGCALAKPSRIAPAPIEHAALDAGNRYDLGRDEARGGHTLERHVGKSDAELHARLQNESISADSTYADRATAEMAAGAAIRENSRRIYNWLHRPGGHSNLVLDYDSSTPLGKSMRLSDAESFPCYHSVVVLKWINPQSYYVLTSYPECWKPQ